MTDDLAVLALDLGSRFGWATSSGASGAVDLRPKGRALDLLDRQAGMFARFSALVADMIHEHRPAIVVCEKNPRLGHLGNAAPVLLGFRAVVMVVCHLHEIIFDEMPSAGKRAADKSDETDAKRLLVRWQATRSQLVRAA